MKKLILAVLMLFVGVSMSMAATVAWDHDGIDVDGFTIYWWKTSDPGTVWNMTAPSGSARELNLSDGWFSPQTVYSFQGEAYNSSGTSAKSEILQWTCELPGYEPPTDVNPPDGTVPTPPDAPDGMTLESAVYKFIPIE
jgi:hypothetical protein